MEQALSAQRLIDNIHTPLVLAHDTLETPEFQRQTCDFPAALMAAGKPVQLMSARATITTRWARHWAIPTPSWAVPRTK